MDDEPYFTVVCTAVEMELATTRYFVRWQLGNMTMDVAEPLGQDGRTTLTVQDVVGLQMGDKVCSLLCSTLGNFPHPD